MFSKYKLIAPSIIPGGESIYQLSGFDAAFSQYSAGITPIDGTFTELPESVSGQYDCRAFRSTRNSWIYLILREYAVICESPIETDTSILPGIPTYFRSNNEINFSLVGDNVSWVFNPDGSLTESPSNVLIESGLSSIHTGGGTVYTNSSMDGIEFNSLIGVPIKFRSIGGNNE